MRFDLAGQKFGRLTAISVAPSRPNGTTTASYWNCRCDCGTERVVLTGNLLTGNSKSCGCLAQEVRAASGRAKRTHGMVATPTWHSWNGMLNRCRNKRDAAKYALYGGRGITFDPRWAKFEEFLADMGERPAGRTLDRIDVDGPYSKENCRWATPLEQSQNRRDNRTLEFEGRTQTVAMWAREYGLARGVLYNRLDADWDPAKALTTPVRKQAPRRLRGPVPR